ncbi:MAG TPA: porphobilinogen synthase [Candidatus Acidoferrales bacterium]|nr:porphobilinogen synthase [Candidatus Acidoferrales bacterium]
MSFPSVRMRRLRRTTALRDMLNQVNLNSSHLIYPIFVEEEIKKPVPINAMPNYNRLPLSMVGDEGKNALAQGCKSVLLFGIPSKKDEEGTSAYAKDGVVQKAIRELKKACRDKLIVIGDVCVCEYMSHGHCGIVKDGEVLNDPTLELLGKVAVSYAEAGVDIVAPSAMMDGQIAAIREALDETGFENIPIMAYSAKYASGFYGPFREAADSTPKFGDRHSYQMSQGSSQQEALREIELDIEEGADMIMVKPALAYLDIITLAKANFNVPIVAYNVSGEYSMVKAVAEKGWIDEKTVTREILTGIKRAGADLIITYHAKDAKLWLNQT